MDTKQLAKLSKLLVMKDNRKMPKKYKGKTLAEVDLNIDYPDHDDEMSTSSVEAEHDAVTSDEQNFRKRPAHQNWSPHEIELVGTRFKEHIDQGSYPSGAILQNFIEEEGLDRTVAVVKAKIQYLIRKQGRQKDPHPHPARITKFLFVNRNRKKYDGVSPYHSEQTKKE